MEKVYTHITVNGYEESEDLFHLTVELKDGFNAEPVEQTIKAEVLPLIVNEYGEPHEFVGNTFVIHRLI